MRLRKHLDRLRLLGPAIEARKSLLVAVWMLLPPEFKQQRRHHLLHLTRAMHLGGQQGQSTIISGSRDRPGTRWWTTIERLSRPETPQSQQRKPSR